MSAPEKFYTDENGLFPRSKRSCESDIEYTQTDTFMHKATIWFNNNFITHDDYGVTSNQFDTTEEMFKDFENYIKE